MLDDLYIYFIAQLVLLILQPLLLLRDHSSFLLGRRVQLNTGLVTLLRRGFALPC